MLKRFSLILALLASPLGMAQTLAETVYYRCPNCGRLHVQAATNSQPSGTQSGVVGSEVQANSSRGVVKASPTVVTASAETVVGSNASPVRMAGNASVSSPPVSSGARVVPSTTTVQSAGVTVPSRSSATMARPRWRFQNANRWPRRIDPRAQAWAQQEANRLAQRGYSGYLQNGHPGGNNPYGSVTGTGTTFPGDDLIHTCEGDPGMTLVAEAAAVGRDGRIYGVRSWR